MCYFVNINLTREALYNKYGTKVPDNKPYDPSLFVSGFSFPAVPVLTNNGSKVIEIMNWGLIPFWVKDEDAANKIKTKTLNARIESVTSKPSFRHTVKNMRCIIPVKGFFEWQHRTNKQKIPWYISVRGQEMFTLAGLYDEWTNKSTGEITSGFTILTREANGIMAEIHNTKKRMPAVLQPAFEEQWLNINLKPSDALELILQPVEDMLQAHPISDKINKPGTDLSDQKILDEVKYPDDRQQSLF